LSLPRSETADRNAPRFIGIALASSLINNANGWHT
jgi:hypothetical protein